jgi:6,7-dimethyl-8-ribityllumazine synthase
MPRVIEGNLVDQGGRYALLVTRFNAFITERLLDGALEALRAHGVDDVRITVVRAPGSMEAPLVAATLAASGRYDAVVVLGCVVKGGTPHFDYVAGEIAKGVSQAAMTTGVPVTFGVLTTETVDQAIERAGTKMGNKGYEATLAAMEMVALMKRLESDAKG